MVSRGQARVDNGLSILASRQQTKSCPGSMIKFVVRNAREWTHNYPFPLIQNITSLPGLIFLASTSWPYLPGLAFAPSIRLL